MKQECHRMRKLFSEYLDGELDDAQRAALEAHLRSCGPCREDLALWRRTVAGVADLPAWKAPEGFAENVMARVRRRPASGGGKIIRLWSKVLPVAAMFVLVSGLTFLVARNGLFREHVPTRQRVGLRGPSVEREPEAAPAEEERLRMAGATMEEELQRGSGAGGAARAMEREAPAPTTRRKAASADALTVERSLGVMNRLERDQVYYFGGEKSRLAFRQVPDPVALRRTPERVLIMNTASPTELLHHAVTTANERGLMVTLELRNGRAADLFLEVPQEMYDRLLRDLKNLPGLTDRRLAEGATPAEGPADKPAAAGMGGRKRDRGEAQADEKEGAPAPEAAGGINGQVEDLAERGERISLQLSIEPVEE